MGKARHKTILAIVATDASFERRTLRGQTVWVGKCLHCNRRLTIAEDGSPLDSTTIEHIVPRTHGGGDDLENLALACARCNAQKGYRHDLRDPGDPRYQTIVETLQARRRKRWRPG